MNKMPNPIARTRDTVTLSCSDWETIVDRLDDTADRTALCASLARDGKDDALPATLYRRILKGEHPLRIWREHRGLGLNALARGARVSAPYLSEIENGSKPGSARALKKAAEAIEIDLDELV